MLGLKPIKLLPARERVASALRKAIIAQQIKEGETLTLETTAQQLGVSITPVREAFQILERDGLISLQQNRGATVLGINEKTLREHYQVRAVLEKAACELCCENGADLSSVKNCIDTAEEALERNDVTDYANQNQSFHYEILLKEAVIRATFQTPLRHNSVETFDEYNTGKNVGKGTPTVFWDIVPDSDKCEIYTYMAGGGCSLPGKAMVLMPGAGYEGVTKFVMDVMTTYGLNACPPLLVGVGVATSVETAALLSKKALMRPIGSHNENERAAYMEKLLENGINSIGLGPQGMGGKYSVMGVHIENTARHPSTIGVAVNVGCWSHRRGHIIFDRDLNYTITTHSGVTL